MTETRFFNVWRTHSELDQQRLVEAMREETSIFLSKPGFLELVVWQGQSGDHRVLADARWASVADFEAAVANSPAAMAGRERMAKFGHPEAGLFREAFRIQSSLPAEDTGPDLPLGVLAHDMDVNGQTIHFLKAGSGPLMLLVHGYPESSRTWLRVMPALARHFTVIAPDTRGTGLSSLARDFSLKDVADDLHALVAALGFRELILVGQDFGVQVVSAYAAQHRDDVLALAVIESPLSGFGLEDLFSSFWHFGFLRSSFAELLIHGREDAFFRAFAFGEFVYQKGAFSDREIGAYIHAQTRPGRLAAGLDYYKALAASRLFFESNVSPPWKFPVLAIDGDHSMAGLTAKSFHRIQPDLEAKLAPDCGHFVQEEQPEFLVKSLLDFAVPAASRPK